MNIYFRDNTTKKIKIATHITFDEAGFTVPKTSLSPTQCTLQEAGYEQISGHPTGPLDETTTVPAIDIQPEVQHSLYVQLLTENARLPVRSTPESAGLDLFSSQDVHLLTHTQVQILTDLAVFPPPGSYRQTLPCSGLILRRELWIEVILDLSYIMYNNLDTEYNIKCGDHIAQMVIYNITHPIPIKARLLQPTQRGTNAGASSH